MHNLQTNDWEQLTECYKRLLANYLIPFYFNIVFGGLSTAQKKETAIIFLNQRKLEFSD